MAHYAYCESCCELPHNSPPSVWQSADCVGFPPCNFAAVVHSLISLTPFLAAAKPQ